MIREFEYLGFKVTHRVSKRMKHTYLSVQRDGSVLIKSPEISQRYLHEVLHAKEQWLLKQRSERLAHAVAPHNPLTHIHFMGALMPIESEGLTEPLYHALRRTRSANEAAILRQHNVFYLQRAKSHLDERTELFSMKMNLAPQELRFRKMTRRWGSCSSKGVITYNTMLMKLGAEYIDYVVVHELAHLKHMNHSPEFHALVRRHLHNADALRAKMRHMGN